MKSYHSILYATDFSECSTKALEYAVDLAHIMNAKLHLLHVVEPLDMYATRFGTEQSLYFDLMKELRTTANSDLQKVAAQISDRGIGVIPVVREGKPAEQIVNYASEHSIALICIATHGWTGFKHLMLGSTTERVLRHAECPVFVVRSEQTKS